MRRREAPSSLRPGGPGRVARHRFWRQAFRRLAPLPAVALLLATLTLPGLSRADDLDALLAQPPSASIDPGDASHRIDLLRDLEGAHPDRQAEIEAYLIPFVRATQPPPVAPTPTPAPPPAKAKPLLLIRGPDGAVSALRATSFTRQGGVIIAVGEDGSRAILQAVTLIGEQLPWYSDQELQSGAVDLGDLANRYLTFAQAMPSVRGVLQPAAAKLTALQQVRDAAVAARQNDEAARVAAVTSTTYDPAAGYPVAQLADLLLAAEKVRNELPADAAKIDGWAAPFRVHFTKLLAGYSYVNGAWASNDDLARLALEKKQAAFLNALDYQISTTALPAEAVRSLVIGPLVVAVLIFAAGVALVIFGRRWRLARILGVVLLVVAPVALAGRFFLATRDPALLPPTIPLADEQPIVDLLSQASGLESGLGSQKISGDVLNEFLARHVRLVSPPGADPATPTRQAIALRLLPGQILVFEMIRALGLNWIVRLDLTLHPGEGQPSLTLDGARIGALDCPSGVADELWANLAPQFAAILAASHVPDRFTIRPPTADTIEFQAPGGGG